MTYVNQADARNTRLAAPRDTLGPLGQLDAVSADWLASALRLYRNWRAVRQLTNNTARLENLGPHILRDIGMHKTECGNFSAINKTRGR